MTKTHVGISCMFRISRREMLKRLGVFLPFAAAWLWAEAAPAADTSVKLPKDKVHYRMVGRNGGTNCLNCRFFEPAKGAMCMAMMRARCQVVSGRVSPMALCDLFVPVSRDTRR